MIKPPLGLRPKPVADRDRAIEIIEAMHRYVVNYKPVPIEWIDELKTISECGKSPCSEYCKLYIDVNTCAKNKTECVYWVKKSG